MDEALGAVVSAGAAGALFTACDALSAESYERGETIGSLLLSAKGHSSVEVLLELTDLVPIRQARAARKALELSRGEVAPLCDGVAIWGLGRVATPNHGGGDDLFEVRFLGRSRWQFRRAGEAIFVVENRRPALPDPPLGRERFEALVRGVLGPRDASHAALLWEAVSAIVTAGCGSTVVITANAAAEAGRLAAQGTRIAPRALAPEVLQAATGIGGAILLDTSGVCHAIGVILDGLATALGERSRGSRFNSAANYVRGRPGALAVVLSEDGSVDLFGG
jgi:hypothetical protein